MREIDQVISTQFLSVTMPPVVKSTSSLYPRSNAVPTNGGRDLLPLAVWSYHMQSNRCFQIGIDNSVDHGSSSIIRPERV